MQNIVEEPKSIGSIILEHFWLVIATVIFVILVIIGSSVLLYQKLFYSPPKGPKGIFTHP